jgi:DNA polymerase-3 subunit delta
MIFFLYGPDSFRIQKKIEELVAYYQKIYKNTLSIKKFPSEELNFEEFQNWLENAPIFAKKTFLILRGVFSNKEFKADFIKNKDKILSSKNIILISEEKEISEKDQLFQFLKANAKCYFFDILRGEKLKNWIKKRAEELGLIFSPQVLDFFIFYLGNDLWQIENELQKLKSYKGSGNVEEADLRELLPQTFEVTVFDIVEAVAKKDKKRMAILISKFLKRGGDPIFLISFLVAYFRNLLSIKDLLEKNYSYFSIQERVKLNPLWFRKLFFQSKNFSFLDLQKIYKKILKLDFEVKNGKVTPLGAIEVLLTEVV